MSRICVFASLCAMFAVPLCAQLDQAVITGTVKDSTGAVAPAVRVTAREMNTNISHTVETNANGVYVIGPIKIGVYEVSASASGFKRAVRSGVELHPSDRIGLDIRLEVGEVVEVVEVSGATPLLQTEQSDISYVVQRRDIEQLPLNSRNYQALALMSAGVVPEIGGRDLGPTMEGGHTRSGFVAHGQPALQNNYVLDGIDNNSAVMGQQDRKSQAVIPSLDAVQEFKVQTSNYTAEYGNNAGAVVNVTIRGGTNEFHGSAYDFLRNNVFDARPTFSYADRTGDGKADPEVLRQNQFGATMGGPIVRNKTFFFGSFEGWRLRRAGTARAIVPSALERNGDFSQTKGLATLKDPSGGVFPGKVIPTSRIDPVAKNIVALFPASNFADALTRNNFLASPARHIDRNQYDVRIDHTLSSRDTIFGRFSYYNFNNLDSGPFPGPAESGSVHDNWGESLALSHTHVFSPTWVNEFRFGYKFLHVNRRIPVDTPLADANAAVGIKGVTIPKEADVWGMSRIQFSGGLGFTQLGGGFNNPNVKDVATPQFVDNVTWLRGNHSIKFGADIRFDRSDIFGGKNARGGFQFDGRYTGISLGDGLLGEAFLIQESRLDIAEYRFQSYMFYIQDDWKLTPKFTLNLGLRYELRTPWMERSGRYSAIDFNRASPTFGDVTTADPNGSVAERALMVYDKNNFGPRIGFAWRVADKWSLRAGAGIFYGGQMGLGADARPSSNFPYASVTEARGTNTKSAGLLRNGVPSGFLGEPATVSTFADFPNNATFNMWDFGYYMPQTEQWNVSLQHQLASNLSLELSYVGSASQNLSAAYNANDGGPGSPATINARRVFPRITSLTFRTPYAHASYNGMDLNLRKRYSSGFTFTFGYTWSHSIGQIGEQFVGGDETGPQDVTCFSCDRGNASSDVRHRGVFSYIYELPFGSGKRYLNRSGITDHILGGWQLTGMIMKQTGQFFDVGWANKNQFLGTQQGEWRANQVGDWVPANQGPDQWFLPSAFAKPCSPDSSVWSNCTQGTLGRNSLREPGIFNWDLGLAKSWRLTERFKLQYRFEAFNLSNTPSFGTPTTGLDSLGAGVIRSTNSTERQIQMGLRMTW